jgi:hypothetical protein
MFGPEILLSLALLGQVQKADQPASESATGEKESAARVLELAKRYEFYSDADKTTKFDLHPQPLLSYANPIRGDVYGNIFVWTSDGRPEVVGAIFDFKSEDKFDSELHTLSRGGIQGYRDGRPFWNPTAAGVKFQKLPGSLAPDDKPAGRLRQMREIARAFTVERDHPEQGKGDMRLLTQPVYRYQSAKAGVLDGSLFVFAEATDPEAYLLLEASTERREWRFALARMNIVEFTAKYRGKEVWHVAPVSWDDVFDAHQPYAIIREKPSRGLVRTRK